MEPLAPAPWLPPRQCTATNREGGRCRRAAIPGGSVCRSHGGAIPAVVASAKLRLLAMVEPVLGVFEEILTAWHRTRCTGCGATDANGNVCVGCGHPTGDLAPVIRVGQLVLDRAGFHPTLTIEQAAPPPNEYADCTEDELIEKLEALLADARASRDLKQQSRLDASAIDADSIEVPEPWPVPPGDEAINTETTETPKENDE